MLRGSFGQGKRSEKKMSYHFEVLGDERFQQLAQALIVASFPHAQCLPVGQPDGGRDAMMYRKSAKGTTELVIFQVKFSRNPKSKTDRDAIVDVIKSEVDKVQKLKKRGATAYYLITNISGTAHLDAGSIDQVNKQLSEALDIPSYCWWSDDLEARINNHSDIKWSFPDILKGTDILQMLLEGGLPSMAQPRRLALKSYIATQHLSDQEVKFKQVELQNKLLDLFVDLPIGMSGNKSRRHIDFATLRYNASRHSEVVVRRPPFEDELNDSIRYHSPHDAASFLLGKSNFPRIVLEGAPGQGKSTITQYLCQVNRLKLLSREADLSQITSEHRNAPVKIPFRIDLRDYASWLNGKNPFSADASTGQIKSFSLEVFIATQVAHLSGGNPFDASDLVSISQEGHAIIVLDGFDEVADIPTRERMVKEISEGAARIQAHDRYAQIIVTSRPAAFTNSPGFNRDEWVHLEIQSMSPPQIDLYSKKWMTARRLLAKEKTEFSKLLNEKLDQPHMRDLSRNPMQLTILLALIHTRGLSLPDKRTALYDNYMELFFNRESEKSRVVREYRDLLIDIHRFLAWTLHVSAEGGKGNGSISDVNLRKLLKIYLEDEGHNGSLVDDLFTGMVERVVALVSRVQGTFEFEVQPLREYFAAKHLYETAPHSPPGAERLGTKPERFEALAQNFYWLNVLRFYCGCYSRGELSSLVDGLYTLARSEGYEDIDHSRTLSIMLLGDWVFTQQPLSVRRVVEDIFIQPGFKRFVAIGMTAPNNHMQIPERCGREEFVTYLYKILDGGTPRDFKRQIYHLIRSNTTLEFRSVQWERSEDRYRQDVREWLEEGRVLGILQRLPALKCIELIDRYDEVALIEVYKSRRLDVIASDETYTDRLISAAWKPGLSPAIAFDRTEAASELDIIFSIFSNHFYRFVWGANGHYQFSVAIQTNTPYGQVVSAKKRIPAHETHGSSVKEVLRLFDAHAEADVSHWMSNIEPWSAICDVAIEKLGPHWGIVKLSVLASGIKSLDDRGSWSEDGWKPSAGLCKRMRYARLRSGNAAWWQQQIEENEGDFERLLICSMIMTWCTPKVILALRCGITQILLSMSSNYWEAFTGVVGATLYATDTGGKKLSLD